MEDSPDASGSKSSTHCSDFGQIPHEWDLIFFSLVPTSHKGRSMVVGTKWNSLNKNILRASQLGAL